MKVPFVVKQRSEMPPLQIDKMQLKNFRAFAVLDITFDPHLTVIVAKNGMGKTAVLDAIALALGPYTKEFDLTEAPLFQESDVRREPRPERAVLESNPQYPLSISANGVLNGKPTNWVIMLNRDFPFAATSDSEKMAAFARRTQQNAAGSTQDASAGVLMPLIAFYGTGRLWNNPKEERNSFFERNNTSRASGYYDCLKSHANYSEFFAWLKRISMAEYEERGNPRALEEIQGMLDPVKRAVDRVLAPTGWQNISYRSAQDGVVAEHEQFGRLPVNWLSDGVRNMIALVADIAHRAVRLNSQLGSDAATKTPGIVLIDEVDMHLHPEWQQTVIASLREAFPRIQFIVTTHSPQVLTTVHKENIRMLRVGENAEYGADIPTSNTYCEESRVMLEDIMGTPSRPQLDVALDLASYWKHIAGGSYYSEDARLIRTRLEIAFGETHNELQMADMEIRKAEAIKKVEGK